MNQTNFHATIWKEENLYIARCLEVSVTSQGKSHNEAVANLKEAFELYLED
jgi:predicted RNase H-like HicB family nuclease